MTDRNTEGRERTITTQTPPSITVLLRRVIWFLAVASAIVLAFRVTLMLLGANPEAEFTRLVYSVAEPLARPFEGVFGTPAANGAVLDLTALLAISVFVVIAWALDTIVAIFSRGRYRRRERVEEVRDPDSR